MLADKFGRELPAGITAESWEIAAHDDGQSIVENGALAGKTLSEVQGVLGVDLIGTNCRWAHELGKFPLLVKLLDAQKNLSVQVHPDDDYASIHQENELGKTEMWVVLHAEDDAKIVLGVREGTTRELFRKAIEDGDLERYLHEIRVRTGDHICVPAGSVHAILGGVVIAEIQQNSNTTYRVYDWNRLSADGKPRQLHIKQAMDVINFQQVEPKISKPQKIDSDSGTTRYKLCRNRYFTVERVEMTKSCNFTHVNTGETFEIWGVIEGRALIQADKIQATMSPVKFVLLPAALGRFTVEAPEDATLLRTYVETF